MSEAIVKVSYRNVEADGVKVFYREAGKAGKPVVLLLHGYPTSSHMFRALIPQLAADYHVIAPDLPGFGFTEVPTERGYRYSFESLAKTIEAFVGVLGLEKYAIYVFDYGAPTGFRLALAHPERVTAIISQNGNAYEEGLGGAWNPIQKYWQDPSKANRDALREFLTLEGTKSQYVHGEPDPGVVAPESYTLDQALLDRPGVHEIQLDLFLDYASNVKVYPAFQKYFRENQPPLLAVWGRHDVFFIPPGAEAYKKDIPGAVVKFLDAGHFALESHEDEVAAEIKAFLGKVL